jgi:hypothetical protein
VFIGGLTLACALWMSMLQRFNEERHESPPPPATVTRPTKRTRSTRP